MQRQRRTAVDTATSSPGKRSARERTTATRQPHPASRVGATADAGPGDGATADPWTSSPILFGDLATALGYGPQLLNITGFIGLPTAIIAVVLCWLPANNHYARARKLAA